MIANMNLLNDGLIFFFIALLIAVGVVLNHWISTIKSKREASKKAKNKSRSSSPADSNVYAGLNEAATGEYAAAETDGETDADGEKAFGADNASWGEKAQGGANVSGSDNPNRQLLLESLRKINCIPKFDEEDKEKIFIKFQGESFCIVQNKQFIRIWDLPYAEVNVLDTNLPAILESINSANRGFGPTIMLTPANENGVREIMSRIDAVFVPSLTHPDEYLSSLFNSFFITKNNLRDELAKWKEGNDKDFAAIFSYASSYQN